MKLHNKICQILFFLLKLYLTKTTVMFYLRPLETSGTICSSKVNTTNVFALEYPFIVSRRKKCTLTCRLGPTLSTPQSMFLVIIYRSDIFQLLYLLESGRIQPSSADGTPSHVHRSP